jgi:transcriptional antiterminator RfaH
MVVLSESPDPRHQARLSTHNDPFTWFVAYTKPGQETVAQINAEQQGFQTYLPMYRTLKRKQAVEQPETHHEPMFPRYLFIKPSRSGQSLTTLRSTRGINAMVAFGNDLATLPESKLNAIREYEHSRNDAEPHTISAIQPGRRVRLANTGLEGLVQSVSSKRVVVLLALLGRQQHVKVAHDQLELA